MSEPRPRSLLAVLRNSTRPVVLSLGKKKLRRRAKRIRRIRMLRPLGGPA